MERLVFDLLSALVLLATALIGAFLPKHLHGDGLVQPSPTAALVFHLGNMLSAGVMLSAGFCHLLADSLRHLSFIGHFPIATFLAATGYILTLAADQVVHMVMERSAGAGDDGAQHGGYRAVGSHSSPPAFSPSPPASPVAGTAALGARTRSGGGSGHGDCCNGHAHVNVRHHGGSGGGDEEMQEVPLVSGGGGVLQPISCSPTHANKLSSPSAPGLSPRHARRGGLHLQSHCSVHANPFEQVLEMEMAVAAPHNHFGVFLSNRRLSFATALLLAGALCIHSVLEGMALGAQSTLRDTEDIFLAIVAHKGLAAYALGASIVESKASDAKFWTTIALFALATPVGIVLGYAFAEHGGGAVGAALSALAAGTFIYVALMEVVPKELEDGSHRGKKMVAMLVGFGLMSLLAVWA